MFILIPEGVALEKAIIIQNKDRLVDPGIKEQTHKYAYDHIGYRGKKREIRTSS